MQTETIHEFALRALVAAGHVSQAKVDEALKIAEGFRAHATQPPAVGVDVSDEMIGSALDAYGPALAKGTSWAAMRAALHAALRTGGGE